MGLIFFFDDDIVCEGGFLLSVGSQTLFADFLVKFCY